MREVPNVLKDAAERCGFDRARYEDSKVPTSMSSIVFFPFFGDMRSSVVLSSLLLRRYREEEKGSKYFICCSWPGYGGLFPYADEFWSIRGHSMSKLLYQNDGFYNDHDTVKAIYRNAHLFFENLVDFSDLERYYQKGLTQNFLDRFKHIKVYKPDIPSSLILGTEFNKRLSKMTDRRVFLYPASFVYNWKSVGVRPVKVPEAFWIRLIERLIDEGYGVVCWQNSMTNNVSNHFADKCVYVTDPEISHVMSAMRATGCVLDVFTNVSRLSLLARCPYVACEERSRYNGVKEYEIDGLLGLDLPRRYIFSFASSLESAESSWNQSLFDGIIRKLDEFLPSINKDALPNGSESYKVVPYSNVRQHKAHKYGVRFIRFPASGD